MSTILIGTLLFCSAFALKSDEPQYIPEVHKLYENLERYSLSKFKLPLTGAGGALMHGVKSLDLTFHSKEFIEEEAVIEILIDLSDKVVSLASENSIIQNASIGNTFTKDQVVVAIIMENCEREKYCIAQIINGKMIDFMQLPIEPAPAIHVKKIPIPQTGS